MNPIQEVYQKMEEDFKRSTPESLYQSFQELSISLGGTPQAWETLLSKPHMRQYIESTLAKYLQVDARKALQRLASAPSNEVSGLVKIIENSKILEQKTQSRQQIFITRIPAKQQPTEPTKPEVSYE